jgi:predicted RNase H-like HicB family nuclease
MENKTFTAVIHREDNLFVAECPEVGTVSQGTSIDEALENLKEATELYLEDFPVPRTGKPFITTFDTVSHG